MTRSWLRCARGASIALTLSACVSSAASGQPPRARASEATTAQRTLLPSPRSVVYGGYDPAATPALRVPDGAIIDIGTVSNCGTRLLEQGVDSGSIEPAIRAIQAAARDSGLKRGPGTQLLTGPVYVEGAEPGDVLEVRLRRIEGAIPLACNTFSPRSGLLPEEFPGQSKSRVVRLDTKRKVGRFDEARGITIPLRPFFGSIGVAPPPNAGRINSGSAGVHGGNLDNKELVEGSALYLPVHVKGALLLVGDGHAAQSDGEVDQTALETALRGRLELVVRKDLKLTAPRAQTPTHWITMGFDADLTTATKLAVKEAIRLLGDLYGLPRDDAYMLVSTACDVRITQLVNGTVGAHVMIPKALFPKP